MGDGTAEIATLSQKLAALAVAETDKDNVFLQERSRHNATEADKDHAFRLFTSWKSAFEPSRVTRQRRIAGSCSRVARCATLPREARRIG